MSILRVLAFFASILTGISVVSENIPCPTFENQSVVCFPEVFEEPTGVSLIDPTGLESFNVINSHAIIFTQHPDPNLEGCELLGEIKFKQNLEDAEISESHLLDLQTAVESLGGNRAVMRTPQEPEASRVYSCE